MTHSANIATSNSSNASSLNFSSAGIGQRFRQIILAVVAILIVQASASAATFTVTNTNDGGTGSLRQALASAGSNPGHDLIAFNIPLTDPNCNATTGVCTIRPQSSLPTIFGPETIDGYTQPGASPNTLTQGTNAVLKIELRGDRGTTLPGMRGLGGYNGVTFRGLIVNNFTGGGITLEGCCNQVLGNFIGTDATGTIAMPNANGSGDYGGITLAYGDYNRIGGDVSDRDRNLISGNQGDGIRIFTTAGTDFSANAAEIRNNLIGVKADGVSPLGNSGHGIIFRNTTSGPINDSLITHNVIAFNGGIGVNIAHAGVGTRTPPVRSRILSNSIYSNGNLGINLGNFQGGVDLNDACDSDAGNFQPNNLQNYPVITSAVTSDGNYLIDGFLDSNAGGTYTLQFFANDTCDASGYGEGKTFLGQTTVTDSDSDCKSNFSASFPIPAGAGLIITATATDSAGNTSEFSSCAPAGPGCLPTDNLVSQYHGENSAYDSQDRNHGTPQNGVSSGEMNFGDGLLGRAFKLDGSNDFVRIPHRSSLNFTNFTLETWVKTDQPAGTYGIIWSKNATYAGYNDPFTLMITADGRAAGRVGKGDNATEVGVASSVAVNDNNWHHLALTFDGVYLRLYRDGNLDDSQPIPFPLYNNTQDVIIGQWAAHVPSALHNYRGLLDELSVHSRALTNYEIAAIHRGGTTGHCQPLITDNDGDGIGDGDDNCPAVANSDQLNTDGDGQGDACDADDDNDGFTDAVETTANSDPLNPNSTPEVCDGQDNDLNDGVDEGFTNTDGDIQADCVDPDDDNDGYSDTEENDAGSDPQNANSTPEVCDGVDNDLDEGVDEGFANFDGDGQADCVDPDDDNDGQTDADELACGSNPTDAGSRATDTDGDNQPDCVDADDDGDGVNDAADNCSLVANASQSDNDHDGIGDACDADDDNDTVSDATDNCPLTPNTNQANNDGDAQGDVCDPDDDNDGVADAADNCHFTANADQTDADADGQGDACDADDDNDGVLDGSDQCPGTAPGTQVNAAGCPDADGDGVADTGDNCPTNSNPDQLNTDGDGQGDACDSDDDNDGFTDAVETTAGSDPRNANSTPEVCDGVDNDLDEGVDEGFTNTDGDAQANCVDTDDDGDGHSDTVEINAGSDPLNANSTPEVCDGQDNDLNDGVDEGFANTDGDAQADCVDADDDNDGQTDADETACGSNPLSNTSKATDTDGDNRPNCVDTDDDNDGVPDGADNCPLTANATQADNDHDGVGNTCDADDDNDLVLDSLDNCPLNFNPGQEDADHDGIGDACDTPSGPLYGICPLYDQEKANKSGSTIPIKLQLCNTSGHNLSSPGIVVTAIGVMKLSDTAFGPVEDSGNANPDFNFRYDPGLAGYIFNLSTKGLTTGTYLLGFRAGSDPTTYTVRFKVK